MTERRTDERRATLDKKITDLAVGVVGMKGAMEGLAKALQNDVDEVKRQLDRQRQLSKYNRRTWFQVMSYIFVVGMLVGDIGRRYCGVGTEQVEGFAGASCNAVFWTTEHGGGVGWRIFGIVTQGLIIFWMTKRAQVPPELYSEVAAAQVRRERKSRKRVE